jgi:hypothetical protein
MMEGRRCYFFFQDDAWEDVEKGEATEVELEEAPDLLFACWRNCAISLSRAAFLCINFETK